MALTRAYAGAVQNAAKNLYDSFFLKFYYSNQLKELLSISGLDQDIESAGIYCKALEYLALADNYDLAQLLLERTSASQALKNSPYPLYYAVGNNNKTLVDLLLRHGANVALTMLYDNRSIIKFADEVGAHNCMASLYEAAKNAAEEKKCNDEQARKAAEEKWLHLSAEYSIQPADLQEFKKNPAKNKDQLVEKVKEIKDPATRQKKQWDLLDSATTGGALLRIPRFLSTPSVSNKSRLREVTRDLERSVRINGLIIDPQRQRALLSDKALQQDLKKSFRFLYDGLNAQGLFRIPAVAPVSETPPPAYCNVQNLK